MISFSRNRELNQSPLQTNERQLAPSPPISLPHAGPTARPQQRTSENDRRRKSVWERESASANRQHFSFIKAKKAFLRGACRHESQSTKTHCEKFPDHNSWQGACKSWRSLKFQLTQVSCTLFFSYSLTWLSWAALALVKSSLNSTLIFVFVCLWLTALERKALWSSPGFSFLQAFGLVFNSLASSSVRSFDRSIGSVCHSLSFPLSLYLNLLSLCVVCR